MSHLVDTHCHLTFPSFQEDLSSVLDQAREKGVCRFMVPGTDLTSSIAAVKLAEKEPDVYAAVGVHPNDAITWNASTLDTLSHLAQHPKVKAIGEIGLDYYRQYAPHPLQQEIFLEQLALAKNLNLPVIIHIRHAVKDAWDILKKWNETRSSNPISIPAHPGVLHSYEDDLQTALEAINAGFFIGISGPITYKNAGKRTQTIAGIPLMCLVLETDSPFLTPAPLRGQPRNHPGNIPIIAQKLADILATSLDNVVEQTCANSNQLFHWDC
ncbi:MAG TPA: TatD family hydrolase [Anaerolineaceae bacterium]